MSVPPSEFVQSREEGDVLIAYIAEKRIDNPNAIQGIASQLFDSIVRSSKARVVLNFKAVEYMTSEFIGKIMWLNKKCQSSDVELRFCEIVPNIMEVFNILQLDKRLNIHPSEENALASF